MVADINRNARPTSSESAEIGLEPTLRTSGPLPRGAWIVNGSGIALEIPDKLLVLPALLKCWEADLLVELHRFCHFADMKRVGSQFVQRHRWFLSSMLQGAILPP